MTTTIYALTSKQGTAMSETVLTKAEFTQTNQERVKAAAPQDWDGRGFSDVSNNDALLAVLDDSDDSDNDESAQIPLGLPSITIFSKDDCPYCESTKKAFTRKGTPFREINVQQDTEPREEFEGKTPFEHVVEKYGKNMPAVVLSTPGQPEEFWLGSRVDKIVATNALFAKAAK